LVASVLVLRIERARRSPAPGGSASTKLVATRRARHATRGFTLIELLVTVFIIGILAVMALPSLSLTSFDRDTYNDAGAIMQLFRRARTRAIARGSAVVVQMVVNTTYPSGGFLVYEAVSGTPGVSTTQIPIASCKWPQTWPTATMTPIDSFQISTGPNSTDFLAGITAQPYAYTPDSPAGVQFTEGYVCYTPLGRSYVNLSPKVGVTPVPQATGTPVFTGFSSLSALEVRVTRADDRVAGYGQTIRSVLIPNNGMARIFTRVQ
jgi:prepilin-type N-terminal cleavage/methylation domain-containing protein